MTGEAGLGEESLCKTAEDPQGELERRSLVDRQTVSQRSGEELGDLGRKRDEQINTGKKRSERRGKEKELNGREEESARDRGKEGRRQNAEGVEKDCAEEPVIPSLSASPSLCLTDAWPSSTSSSSSSSSQPAPALPPASTPPLPCLSPALADVSVVLADARLTLDVYRGGAAALPALWEAAPGQLGQVRYLRLGSEDQEGLQGALTVLPLLTQLRSLAIRGSQLDPRPRGLAHSCTLHLHP